MAEQSGLVSAELRALADQVRRQPQLAREMDVSVLVDEVAGRWREHSDMLQASEEVPVAAWIVRRKVEGLIRPEAEPDEPVPLDPALKPEWVGDGVAALTRLRDAAAARWPRPVPERLQMAPVPVKDPSLWKLAWSYPRLRPKSAPAPQVVARETDPLDYHMEALWTRIPAGTRIRFLEGLRGRGRDQWVAQFLALVHLWHVRRVEAEQSGPFQDLWVERREEGDPR
jgi:segregation and condensation protein A